MVFVQLLFDPHLTTVAEDKPSVWSSYISNCFRLFLQDFVVVILLSKSVVAIPFNPSLKRP